MKPPVIQTQDLRKIFRDFWMRPSAVAVDGLDLTVNQGEVFGLLGPNGSGKSTTIKMLLGLLFPTAGQISIFGQRPDDVRVKQRIGFLPEESYLYKHLNAEETLDFYGRLFNLPASERELRVEALLRLTGLLGARKRLLGGYSKGMARRIGIAQALINDPDLVILDEPTSGLDPIGNREIKDIILTLKEKGKTVLLSSHLLADVEDVCDRIMILYGGKCRCEGTTSEVLRHQRHTQITAEMDAATAAEAASFIRGRCGEHSVIEVAPAAQRLEQVFLKIVEEARAAQADTSGAAAGTGELAFLSSAKDKPEDVLQRLTKHQDEIDSQDAPQAKAAPAPEAEKPQQQLLDALTAAKESLPETVAVTEAAAPEPEKADKGILDQLVKGDDREAK